MLANALSLDWAYGFSKDRVNGMASLCLKERNALFLISSHSGVIYDFEHRTQTILQGHCNIISCCVIDKNKRWIVTADTGIDPIMVVWDAITFVPVKTFTLPHEGGIEALDISDDSLYIATLGCPTSGYSSDQELAIWAWTLPDNDAILRQRITSDDYQFSVKFDLTNPSQVVTTGDRSVLFWRWDDFNLACYSGRVSKTDLGHFGGNFVTTVFLPSTENALTATSEGYVIVWESNVDEEKQKLMGHAMKEATKVLKLVDCGISLMTTTQNDYLAIACADGAVRFYDYFLRLEAWFEDLKTGPITSLSFSVQDCPYPYGEAGAPGLKFWVPDFVVGTSDGFVVGVESSIFDEVRREDRRGTLLMQGMSEEVTSVSCHPQQPLVVIACANGVLQVWNYDMKLLMILREFNSNAPPPSSARVEDKRLAATKARSFLRPQCTAFDASGKVLAVGFTTGQIKLLFTENLEDGNSYAPSSEAILSVKFSASGKFFAAYDSSRHVLLFKKDEPAVAEEKHGGFSFGRNATKPATSPLRIGTGATQVIHDASYVYIGRARSHTAEISGICFGMKDGQETLISVSEDQYCVEYDLLNSTLATGVMCVKSLSPNAVAAAAANAGNGNNNNNNNNNNNSNHNTTVCSHRIELSAKPTAVMWHPKLNGDFEDRFVIANDVFKFKEFNLESKQCRRTSLAPRFGNPPTTLLVIPPPPRPADTEAETVEGASNPPAGSSHRTKGGIDEEAGFGGEHEEGDGEEKVETEVAPPTVPQPEYFAFATNNRVIGLSSFPLTGDPSQTMGIVAHPNEVTSLAVSFDGRYLFSAGGYDLSVNMWKIDVEEHKRSREISAAAAAAAAPNEEVADEDSVPTAAQRNAAEIAALRPFFSLLEGGEGGELHQDIVDYFYYCQLRALGEDSMETRELTGEIPLEEMPSLFRSVGFYPSEDEVLNMVNEVRYKNFVNTGETQDFVGLSELIRLYVNHRPALPLDKHYISAAFSVICDSVMDHPAGRSGHHQIPWELLRTCLMEEGECVSAEDLDAYLIALTGGDASSIPGHQLCDPKSFAEHILGFEDFANSSTM